MTLKQKTFSAVRWTTFSMLSKAALMLLQMAVLARLLTPSDFGLMALVAAVISFAQIFSDMGISNAIIHHQKISQEALSSLYWLNVLSSAVLMFLLMLLSPLVSDWYHEPRMQPVLVFVSASFLIAAIGQQLRVMAEKNLRFQQLAVVELAASLLGFVVSVSVAFYGGGVYALVAGMLTSGVVATVLYWRNLADGWRPMWRLRFDEIRDFLGFGAYVLGFSLTNTVNIQADILIGGRVLGTSNLGAYSLPKELSFRLALIINPIVTRVGLPVMAQAQKDKALLKSIYLKTLLMTASINFPLYLMIAVFAPEIVSVMFGNQWQESVPLLQVMALWGLVRSTGNPVGSLLLAMGRANWMFWWSFGQMLFWVPIFWLGSKFGTQGLAMTSLIAVVLSAAPMWYVLVRPSCGAGFVEYFKLFAVPLLVSVVGAAAGFLAVWAIEIILLRLAVGLTVGGAIYLILSRWFNRTWFAAISELVLGRVRSAKLLALS